MGYGEKPKSVTILMALAAIMALIYLADALVTFWDLSLTNNAGYIDFLRSQGAADYVINNIGTILTVETIILFAIMVIYYLEYIGFQHGRRWAWGLGLVLGVAGVFFTVLDLFLFPGVSPFWQYTLEIVVPILLLLYLLQPRIRHYFLGAPGETETPDLELN
ncbi:MAG TPA: hypothetical protein VMS79_00685 [Methanomassiliicoccales archaeon]|nr:hypothetical protein [Methanomassiliicoccales archaeon]